MPLSSDVISLEDFEKRMIAQGYQNRVFDTDKYPTSYRSWYYRNRKRVIISHAWHLDSPQVTVWFKPIAESMTDSAREVSNEP